MRSLRKVLEDGDPPSREEQIYIRDWLERYPQTDLAGRLAERYPHLVEADDNDTAGRT